MEVMGSEHQEGMERKRRILPGFLGLDEGSGGFHGHGGRKIGQTGSAKGAEPV
jgi:hypothetical protein